MGKATYGAGTIFKRGRIWYLSYYVDGQQVVRSSRSANVQDAKRLRDQILGKKSRGELGDAVTVTGDSEPEFERHVNVTRHISC